LLLEVDRLHVDFAARGGTLFGPRNTVRAVNDVSLGIERGRTLGLVGESGCGKTTLLRTILRLQPATSGRILLNGDDLTRMTPRELRRVRPKMQIVFQDPASSLNPGMTIHDIVAEPLRINRRYQPERVEQLLGYVGMTPEIQRRRPAEFSGGQRQRIGIARALALEPELLVLDEPVSALDVSIQAQVINLLVRLQGELNLTYLFIAHDLSVVGFMSHDVAVMYRGRIVEMGPRAQVLDTPAHPYTQALIAAAPVPRPEGREERRRLKKAVDTQDGGWVSTGCAFRPRCPRAQPRCAQDTPLLVSHGVADHRAACFYPG
jgi:oligopeptide/dipeptide ABC transporter ATP-binding protein